MIYTVHCNVHAITMQTANNPRNVSGYNMQGHRVALCVSEMVLNSFRKHAAPEVGWEGELVEDWISM